jgi:hypothetical protein
MRLFLLTLALLAILSPAFSAQYTLTGWASDGTNDHWQRQIGEKIYTIDILDGKIAYSMSEFCLPEAKNDVNVIIFSEERNFTPLHISCDGTVTLEVPYTLAEWLDEVGGLPEEITLFLLTH